MYNYEEHLEPKLDKFLETLFGEEPPNKVTRDKLLQQDNTVMMFLVQEVLKIMLEDTSALEALVNEEESFEKNLCSIKNRIKQTFKGDYLTTLNKSIEFLESLGLRCNEHDSLYKLAKVQDLLNLIKIAQNDSETEAIRKMITNRLKEA